MSTYSPEEKSDNSFLSSATLLSNLHPDYCLYDYCITSPDQLSLINRYREMEGLEGDSYKWPLETQLNYLLLMAAINEEI